ncbi:MAG TPA: hypothetical protein DDZ42_21185 [Candidatus Rokubacteria bacterium]|nr:hypothetical protein [Candidatus Rokubacteria bacterium]
MECPRCRQDNPPAMKFCGECDARLAAVCVACGTRNPPGQKFCGECGVGLGESPPAARFAAPRTENGLHVAEPLHGRHEPAAFDVRVDPIYARLFHRRAHSPNWSRSMLSLFDHTRPAQVERASWISRSVSSTGRFECSGTARIGWWRSRWHATASQSRQSARNRRALPSRLAETTRLRSGWNATLATSLLCRRVKAARSLPVSPDHSATVASSPAVAISEPSRLTVTLRMVPLWALRSW